MVNLPNFKHLHYLVMLHQYRHFHKAAAACFISQSTLSSAIIKLEEQLNCQLIERDHKAFIFTPQGEAVVNMAQELLNGGADLINFAKSQGKVEEGDVTIGCIPTVAPYLLSDLAKHSRAKLPGLSLYFVEDTTEQLLVQLANGKVDLLLLALPVAGHNFKSKVLGQDRFYIAGEKSLVRRFNENHDYQCLPEHSVFLLSEQHCLTEHAISACQLTERSRIHPFSAASLATLVQMTEFHKGVTFLPELAVNKGLGKEQSLLIEKLDDGIYRDIGILWRPTSMRQQTYFKIGEIVQMILAR